MNSELAGSLDSTWKLIDGTSVWFFSQMSYWVKDPPTLTLCDPRSQFTVSSSSTLFALRDCGVGAGAGLVNVEPTDGKISRKPFWFAMLPLNCALLNSAKNWTGAPL